MANTQKCETHDTEISQLRNDFDGFNSEFNGFKIHINDELTFIKEAVKPQFTKSQFAGFFMFMLSSLVAVMIYVENIKSDVRLNTEMRKIQTIQNKKIITSLNTLLIDVAVIKAKDEEK